LFLISLKSPLYVSVNRKLKTLVADLTLDME
jgi:hypothetical protein